MRAPLVVGVRRARVAHGEDGARPATASARHDALPMAHQPRGGGRAPASTRTACRTAGRRTRASRRRGAPAAGACVPASPAGSVGQRAGSPRASRTPPARRPARRVRRHGADLASATTCGNHRRVAWSRQPGRAGRTRARAWVGSASCWRAWRWAGCSSSSPSATSGRISCATPSRHLDARWLVPAVASACCSRSSAPGAGSSSCGRWRTCPFGTLWVVISVAYMAINLLPVRMGEVVRPWLLSRRSTCQLLERRRQPDHREDLRLGGDRLLHPARAAHDARTCPTWVRRGAVVPGRRVRRARGRSSCCSGGGASGSSSGWVVRWLPERFGARVRRRRALPWSTACACSGDPRARRARCSSSRSCSGSFPSCRAG